MIPVGTEVELANQPDWKSSSPSLVTEYILKVPGWVSGAGKLALLPVALFSAPEKGGFDNANRDEGRRKGWKFAPDAKPAQRPDDGAEGKLSGTSGIFPIGENR